MIKYLLVLCAFLSMGVSSCEAKKPFGFGKKVFPASEIVYVTTTADYLPFEGEIPGSLRSLIKSGDKVIRFKVSGNIKLKNTLMIDKNNISIDGSTAPNGGISISQYNTVINASNVILSNIRFRGLHPTETYTNLTILGGSDIVIDHVSCSWAKDGCIDIAGYNYVGSGTVRNVTIQYSLLAEPIGGTGTLIDGDVAQVSFFRNVYTKFSTRSPQITTGRRHETGQGGYDRGPLISGVGQYEIVNSIIYDSIYGTNLQNQSPTWTMELDVIGNHYILGPPATVNPKIPIMTFATPVSLGPIKVHLKDNHGRKFTDEKDCNYFAARWANLPCSGYAEFRADSRLVKAHPLPEMFTEEQILNEAGATKPCRDSVDSRLISEIKNRQRGSVEKVIPSLDKCGVIPAPTIF